MRPFTEIRFRGTEEEINQQWLKERRKGIGGSDVAAILGISQYSTPLAVWLDKTGQVIPEDISDKPAVYWGKKLEDVVAAEFAHRHPDWKVRRKNALLRSIEYPFMQASLDREVVDSYGRKGVLEIKTCNERLKSDWDNGIPDYYLPQPIHYLAVTGYEFYAVAVLIGGQHYADFIYERDEEDIEFVVRREAEFWSLVETGTMPIVTGSKCDTEALMEIHSDPTEDYISALTMDIPEILELSRLTSEIKSLESKKSEVSNRLKERIGDNRGIITDQFKVTWVRSKTSRFDSKALRDEMPDVYEKFTRTYAKDGGIRVSEIKE